MTRIPRPSIPDNYDPTPLWLGALPPEVGFEPLPVPLLSVSVAQTDDYIIYNSEGESERIQADSALKALKASQEEAPIKVIHALCMIGFVFQEADLEFESLHAPNYTNEMYAALMQMRKEAIQNKKQEIGVEIVPMIGLPENNSPSAKDVSQAGVDDASSAAAALEEVDVPLSGEASAPEKAAEMETAQGGASDAEAQSDEGEQSEPMPEEASVKEAPVGEES